MKSPIKTILCKYYIENRCKFVNSTELCSYAHGNNDLKTIDCKFGARCTNVNCKFYHGDINVNKIENIEHIIKIDKKIIKNNKIKVIQTITPKNDDKDYYNIYKELDLLINLDVYNNLDKIKNNDNFDIQKFSDSFRNSNNLLSIDKYIAIIKDKNIIISKLKNQLEKQKMSIKNKYNLNLYDKYFKIYNILEGNNYDQLKIISEDKNIYKLKLRSKRVKEYIDMIKKYDIKELLPISTILNSTKITFSNILQNIIKPI